MNNSNTYVTNVPRLKGRENYHEWAFAAENLLILDGNASFIKKESTTENAIEDAKVKAKLILTIDPSLYVHIKGSTSTKNLWMKLRAMFDDSGFARKITLLRNLISIRLENCDSMTDYVTQIIETGQRLSGTGFDVNDEWIGSLLLAGLPEKYFPMIMAIEHSGIAITADVVKTKLIDLAADSEDEQKQRTVALSSMEAEYMSIAEAYKEAIYLRSLLFELTGNLNAVILYNDSQSAQKLASVDHVCHKRSKHIDIRYHFVKDVVVDKIVNLKYMPTTDMPADVLTKALNPIKHYKCIEGMGISQIESGEC